MTVDLVVRCRAEIDRLRVLLAAATPVESEHEPRGWLAYLMPDGRSECFGGPAEYGYRTGTVWHTYGPDCEVECSAPSAADQALIVASVNSFPAALDAFTAILDGHHPTTCEAECAIPCPIVAAVAAALGVGDQP